jgi:hypothetical protein
MNLNWHWCYNTDRQLTDNRDYKKVVKTKKYSFYFVDRDK